MNDPTPDRPRVILVTGAASGIGAATARMLARPSVALLLHTRANAAGVERVAEEVRARGALAETMLGDLAQPHAPGAAVDRAVAAFGGLDAFVSNAGFADRTPVEALDDAAFARSADAITWAFLRLARAAIPHLRHGRAPRIVAVSSFVAHAFRADVPLFAASAAAKAAMEALVRALALELGPAGVTVNAVVPGFIRKDSGAHAALDPAVLRRQIAAIPLGRIGLPDDVAAAVAYLMSQEAGYVTGQALHVSGGLVV
jgi:NAD(P)-dependent dehydrogenase (short-subunit alcohol dehydrogenase family)